VDSGEGVKPSLAKRKFRLSGWARLSIVIASLFWIAGTTLSLTSEFSRWDYECNWPDCPGYKQSRDVAYKSDQQRPTRLEAQAELNRRLFLQAEHQGRLIAAVRDPFLIATIVFLLLMLAKSTALWIWRGFKGGA
jgi:hypothetical protein